VIQSIGIAKEDRSQKGTDRMKYVGRSFENCLGRLIFGLLIMGVIYVIGTISNFIDKSGAKPTAVLPSRIIYLTSIPPIQPTVDECPVEAVDVYLRASAAIMDAQKSLAQAQASLEAEKMLPYPPCIADLHGHLLRSYSLMAMSYAVSQSGSADLAQQYMNSAEAEFKAAENEFDRFRQQYGG
jgi:hypothetical protein